MLSFSWLPAQHAPPPPVQVGSDDDGYAVRMKLSWYFAYISHPEHIRDDSPLYIFDGTFSERSGSCG